MILADTSIWVEHLRGHSSELAAQLAQGRVIMHPLIVAEIALGSLRQRPQRLAELDLLLEVKAARLSEVRQMIEVNELYSKGIGLIDAELIASCLLTPGTQLWTRDAAMEKVARSLGIPTNQTRNEAGNQAGNQAENDTL